MTHAAPNWTFVKFADYEDASIEIEIDLPEPVDTTRNDVLSEFGLDLLDDQDEVDLTKRTPLPTATEVISQHVFAVENDKKTSVEEKNTVKVSLKRKASEDLAGLVSKKQKTL